MYHRTANCITEKIRAAYCTNCYYINSFDQAQLRHLHASVCTGVLSVSHNGHKSTGLLKLTTHIKYYSSCISLLPQSHHWCRPACLIFQTQKEDSKDWETDFCYFVYKKHNQSTLSTEQQAWINKPPCLFHPHFSMADILDIGKPAHQDSSDWDTVNHHRVAVKTTAMHDWRQQINHFSHTSSSTRQQTVRK